MISILLPDLRGGGAERVNLDLAHEFARQGHRVEFVLMKADGELLTEAQAAFSVVDLNCPRVRNLPLALTRYLRRRRPDALLAAMWPLTGIAGIAARLSGRKIRVVASEHVDFRSTPSLKPFERLVLSRFGRLLYAPCSKVVGVSVGVCESLEAVAGLSTYQLLVIHNPVRQMLPEAVSTQDQNLLSGWLEGKEKLIAIGSLKRQKGFDVLLRAFAKVRQHRDIKLLILGDGNLRRELEDLAKELGIEGDVWLPGFRSNPGTFLKHADCFVLSSHWEGFGNVVVEALSVGLPVVSTDCPSGPSDILAAGKFGILTPPGDFSKMASAICMSLDKEHDLAPLKARAADFNPQKQAEQYLKLLTKG